MVTWEGPMVSISLLVALFDIFFVKVADGFGIKLLDDYSKAYPNVNNYDASRQKQGSLFSNVFNADNGNQEYDVSDEKEGNNRSHRLIIFGYGNVGRSVIDLIEKIDNHPKQQHHHHQQQEAQSIENDILVSSLSSSTPLFEKVYATVRSSDLTHSKVSEEGSCVTLLSSEEHIVDALKTCTHILITIPPIVLTSDKDHADDRPKKYVDLILDNPKYMNTILSESLSNKGNDWIGYVSTTGVYGNHDNQWVDESSSINCANTTKAALYYDIENKWKSQIKSLQKNLCVFRCAGLYGNDFSALHTIHKNNKIHDINVSKDINTNMNTTSFTSRIHLDDVARAIVASMMTNYKKQDINDMNLINSNIQIYNLADDEPAPRSTVMAYASQLFQDSGIVIPSNCSQTQPFTSKTSRRKESLSERSLRRNKDRKRILNTKLKRYLLPNEKYGGLKYPTYREGLTSILHRQIDIFNIPYKCTNE